MIMEAVPRKNKTIRDSFLNMLGEFVALNKSPDYKLNSYSTQCLAESIRDEIRQHKQSNANMFNQSYPGRYLPKHMRTNSTNSAYNYTPSQISFNPNGRPPKRSASRQSLPIAPFPEANGFFQRIRLNSHKVSDKKLSVPTMPTMPTDALPPKPSRGIPTSSIAPEKSCKHRARKQKLTIKEMMTKPSDKTIHLNTPPKPIRKISLNIL